MNPHDDLNASIRRAAGRSDPRELAREALDAAARAGDASALRERLAVDAGLPAELASRLQGNDAGELKADAEQLAQTLGELAPAPPKSARQTLNDGIRAAAGRAPAAEAEGAAEDEPPAVNMDGGAHGRQSTAPPPEPSMNALLRGARDEKRERIADRASAYDDIA